MADTERAVSAWVLTDHPESVQWVGKTLVGHGRMRLWSCERHVEGLEEAAPYRDTPQIATRCCDESFIPTSSSLDRTAICTVLERDWSGARRAQPFSAGLGHKRRDANFPRLERGRFPRRGRASYDAFASCAWLPLQQQRRLIRTRPMSAAGSGAVRRISLMWPGVHRRCWVAPRPSPLRVTARTESARSLDNSLPIPKATERLACARRRALGKGGTSGGPAFVGLE